MVPELPELVLTEIIEQYLLDSTLAEGLNLRLVSCKYSYISGDRELGLTSTCQPGSMKRYCGYFLWCKSRVYVIL